MLYGDAKNPSLIDEYLDLRDTAIRNGVSLEDANEFWKENQENLEEGLKAGWEDNILKPRFRPFNMLSI